jgi:hypothetical protein
MVLRMAEALLEADVSDRADAMRCLRQRGFLAGDVARLIDQARDTAASVRRSMD